MKPNSEPRRETMAGARSGTSALSRAQAHLIAKQYPGARAWAVSAIAANSLIQKNSLHPLITRCDGEEDLG